MTTGPGAFVKGGLGCIALFVVLALLAVLMGGRAQIDLGGAIFLFVVGGVIGLIVLWIYNSGKRDSGPHPADICPGCHHELLEPNARFCPSCGRNIMDVPRMKDRDRP